MLPQFIICLCVASSVVTAPQESGLSTPIPIVAQSDELEANGTFKYSFETGNGIKFEESSYDKEAPPGLEARSADDGKPEEIHVQEGSYSYTAPDGTVISLRYVADENGFQPVGNHLPTTPPIPEEILKSLQEQQNSASSNSAATSAP